MSISASLNASVSGLAANSSRLSTISDNIANSGTIGYKRAETSFRALVSTQGSGSYSAGGVSASSQRLIDEPGALRTTSNSTDLAVRGSGFLPVTTESAVGLGNSDFPLFLSTTGSFRTDKDGYLKTTSGLVLMGWPANPDGSIPNFARDTGDGLEPVQINVNQSTAEPTTNVSLGVNLPATSTEYSDDPAGSNPLSVEYFDNLGRSQSLDITFTPTVPAAPADPATNTWTMVVTDSASAGAVVGEYEIIFTDSRTAGGTIDSVTTISGGTFDAATGLAAVTVAGGDITLDLGVPGTGSGLTQLSESFAPTSISKDGSPVGNMTSVEVDPNGFVTAQFDTGVTRTVYQIPLVNMSNPNGLISQDNQTYSNSIESGSIFLWDAGDGGTGDIVGFALEESATDVASELTALIQTQRAYSSNAKVIQTVDEMLQETTNIKR